MKLELPIEEILATPPHPADYPPARRLGESRQGRPLFGLRLGTGPAHVSLIAGCHADEPVGPAMLDRLAAWLASREADSPVLQAVTWRLVPHANPDGEAANATWSGRLLPAVDHLGADDAVYDLPTYLEQAVRELPGDDVEFGFPHDLDDAEARPENRAMAAFWVDGAPFALHATFHGMAFARGPWFLLEAAWQERSELLREHLGHRVHAMGYELHDVDRRGEKGFCRIAPGFCTRPDSRAMAAHFIAQGDAATAALFRPSSMEFIRGLGGDPLTLVSEMPLFLLPDDMNGHGGQAGAPPLPTGTEGRLAFLAWAQRSIRQHGRAGFEQRAAHYGLRPMPIRDQMRLQLDFLNEALALL